MGAKEIYFEMGGSRIDVWKRKMNRKVEVVERRKVGRGREEEGRGGKRGLEEGNTRIEGGPPPPSILVLLGEGNKLKHMKVKNKGRSGEGVEGVNVGRQKRV